MAYQNYQHIFFDLDRTLWDFNFNSEACLRQLFREYQLESVFGSFLFFKSRFDYHNRTLRVAYYQNRIEKTELLLLRFLLALQESGCRNLELAKQLSSDFMEFCPLQTKTFPHAHEMLHYLKDKGYGLHIITNGFKEVQKQKLKNCKLDVFFSEIITSEDAGANKPSAVIFKYALHKAGANPENSIMVGDDLKTDIVGAKNAQIDQIYFNPKKHTHCNKATFEIFDLQEIKTLL